MRMYFDINCIIKLDYSIPGGQWISWCPDLDVMSQGDHPDHTVAMLEEAIAITVGESVSYRRFEHDEYVVKRVHHPLRLGIVAFEDEMWHDAQRLMSSSENLNCSLLGNLSDDLTSEVLVRGVLSVVTRAGVIDVKVAFSDYGFFGATQ